MTIPTPPEVETQARKATSIRALILDMDGVLWRSTQPIGNLPEIFERIAQMGWKAVLATNNATLSVEQYLSKLQDFGVSLKPWQLVNSSQAAAHYLKERHAQGGPVYVVGEEGLISTLQGAGFYLADRDVLAVVAGMDRGLTFNKLRLATLLIRAGAPFIGTNPDRTFPTPEGQIPGAGAILAAIEAATGIQPLIMGKPSPEMYRIALERLGTTPGQTLVVGDRLETDIAGAQALGCLTGLVLSGVTSAEAAHRWSPVPDFIADNLSGLLELLGKMIQDSSAQA